MNEADSESGKEKNWCKEKSEEGWLDIWKQEDEETIKMFKAWSRN